ncbi:MAG: histidine phosphotransferase family protein [Bauldia sp.]
MERRDLDAMDLAALLCSRVCHDIISPVGAITNGLEVLDEDDGEEMKTIALDLIRKSSANASAKLQFARLAFGAAGSAGASIDLADAEKVARGYMQSEKASISWEAPAALMAKNRVKLLLNLLLLAIAAVPRGGTIKVAVAGPAETPSFTFHCAGPNARVPAAFEHIFKGELGDTPLDAHGVQPYYAGLLARSCGMAVESVLDGADVLITAKSTAAA